MLSLYSQGLNRMISLCFRRLSKENKSYFALIQSQQVNNSNSDCSWEEKDVIPGLLGTQGLPGRLLGAHAVGLHCIS